MKTERFAKNRLRVALMLAALVVLVGLPLYVWATFEYTYSVGDRVGVLQKLTESGWACRTHKGALSMVTVPGGVGQTFGFNVRDAAVARKMDELAGHRVIVHYEQHKGVPSTCFGDSQYFVTGLDSID